MKEESEKAGLKSTCKKKKNEDHVIWSHHFMANRWGNNGNMRNFIFLDSKITADGDCSHEIKRCSLLGRKAMTNLHNILKSRPELQPDMGLEDKQRMLTGSGDPKEEEEEEEELADLLTTMRGQCEQMKKCVKAREQLEFCDERVSSRSQAEEDCTEELFDFLHARDHCKAHKLFNSLK